MGIQFWIAFQGPVADYLQAKTNEWNKSHIECQVEIKNTAGNLNYGQPADVALKSPPAEQPSLVLAPEFMTSTLTSALAQKKLIPIYEILNDTQLKNIAEIVKRTFGDSNGRAISLPFNPACGVLYTNKEALKAIGKNPDFIPQSIEELEAICKEMIEKKVVDNGYTCAWPAAYLVEVPAAQQDVAMVVPNNGFNGFGNYQLSQSWFCRHLLDIRRQINEGIFVYAGKDNNAKKPFIEKKVAFYMQGSTHFAPLQKEASFEIGCGPIPNLTHGAQQKFAFPLGGASIWVMNNEQTTRAIKGVREYLDYLSSDEVQRFLHEQMASVPVSATLPKTLAAFYKDHPLHQAIIAQTIDAKLGNFSYGIHMPNYKAAREKLFEVIEQIVDVKKTSDAQVEELLKQFDHSFSIAERN